MKSILDYHLRPSALDAKGNAVYEGDILVSEVYRGIRWVITKICHNGKVTYTSSGGKTTHMVIKQFKSLFKE